MHGPDFPAPSGCLRTSLNVHRSSQGLGEGAASMDMHSPVVVDQGRIFASLTTSCEAVTAKNDHVSQPCKLRPGIISPLDLCIMATFSTGLEGWRQRQREDIIK